MLNLRLLHHADWVLWICVGLLACFSFALIYSATAGQLSKEGKDPWLFVKKHAAAFLLGFIFMLGLAYLDYEHLRKISFILYPLMLILLGLVLFKGLTAQGAQRWINLGPYSIQPSEISKLLFIIFLAGYLTQKRGQLNNISSFFAPLILTGLPFILIFKQPDLGTALSLGALFFGMLLWGEADPVLLLLFISPILSIFLRPFWIAWVGYIIILGVFLYLIRFKASVFSLIFGGNLVLGLAFPYLWGMLKGYQRERLLTFFNPGLDPLGAGYHTLQSKIAVGSGGLLGKGFLHGTQTQFQFIPQQWTDFIFSVVGEEFGFLGSLITLVLFAVVIWRGIKIASDSKDFFGGLLAMGISVIFAFHFLVNVGMTIGLLPVVGIPLPFLSFGGTALVVNLGAVGILQSISMRREKILF